MGSRVPQPHSSAQPPAVATPVKQIVSLQSDAGQYDNCPYGSPIGGLCTGAAAPSAASTARTKLHMGSASTARHKSVQPELALTNTPASYAARHGSGSSAAARTGSMPEPWQAGSWPGRSTGRQLAADQQPQQQHMQQMRLSADNKPRRDQDLGQISPGLSPRSSYSSVQIVQQSTPDSSPAHSSQGQPVQQQALLPLDVLLSPLLPSADEAKFVDRLSQLRHALDEHVRLAAGWEQQAVTLQAALSQVQEDSLQLRGQVASQQQHINLLGGNLQGRLSLVQGSVLAQMQEQVTQKDAALAASAQHVMAIQAELEKLSCSYAAKLAAEQAERQRLSAEAAQARLMCTARGRQVASLQQELQQTREAASQQQQTAAASTTVQQQQLESLRERLQDAQQQLETARFEVLEAQQIAAAAEGGRSGLRQQVEELQALLTEKQLQVEWLEGKVADLEGSDISQQLRRHQAEVARLQETAAADHRTLEQQLAAAHRQVAQLQQQDQTAQQALAQLEQQAQHLQQQLAQRTAESEDLQQQLAQQAAVAEELQQQLHEREQHQHSSRAEAELAQQLSAADAELQQLREQLAEAEEEISALTQQLQQQERELHAHAQREFAPFHAEQAAGVDDAASADADDGGNSPHVPAAELHALRAELGIANAEVARLRHQLDVAQASQQQERELTGHEIMRLQQELSEAAASGSGGAAAADAAGAEEVTSRLGANRVGSDSSSSWHSVHDNPAFEHAQQQYQQQHQQQRSQQDELQLLLCASGEEEGSEDGHSDHTGPAQQHSCQALADVPGAVAGRGDPANAAGAAVAASKLARYESKLQDQADTISSLQRQLKQQEQLLVAVQKRERRVFDSAASKGSWADALGFEHQMHQLNLPAATAAAAALGAPAGSVIEPATPHTDAAVQTDLSGPAESAGSTAAAPAATVSEDAAAAQTQWQQDQQASSRQQVAADAGAAAGEAGASSALLAAARHEILRLQELNRQLMQAHAEELKASVSFEDARRAVSEAKQHAKAKAAAMLQSSNKTWSDKLTAARAEAQQLHEQLQDLQQQRDELAQQVSAQSQSHQPAVHQLQQELISAQQHSQALSRQLQDMADSHMQELEQVRMEMEADAAAAMLDAAAASNKLSAQQQQRCAMRESAAQTDVPAAAAAADAAAQTDSLPESRQDEQHVARFAGGQSQVRPVQQALSVQHQQAAQEVSAQQRQPPQQQQQQQEGDGHSSLSPADSRPGTPQPAAASPGPALGPNPDAAAPADVEPAAAQTPQQQRLTSSWRSAAAAAGGGAAADAGDDDICRFSSASDTPASASSRGPVSRFRGSLHAQGADGVRPGSAGHRPGSAEGAAGLPELTATNSPIAPSSIAKPPVRQTMQQQQQQQRRLAEQQQQQQQDIQLQQQQADKGSAQMSSWHAELLQQQAELEALRTRLSQQKEPAWKASGPGSSSKSSPAVAHSRTLLLAPFAPALSDPVGGVGSPAGPVLSSSSPLTYQQRRAAAQAAAAAAAAAPAAAAAAAAPSSTRFTDGVSAGLPQQLYSQQPAAAAAEQLQYGQQQQQQQHGSAAAAAVGRTSDYTRWRSSSSPDGLTNSLLMGSPQVYLPSAGRAMAAGADVLQPGSAPSGVNSNWGLPLTATAARRSVSPIAGSSSGPLSDAAQQAAATAGTGQASVAASAATAAGLSKLGDDVFGALSLSRYHRERSKLQEARAKQHALMASHHEYQAAALRNSRLGAQGAAGVSATGAATAAGLPGGAAAGNAAGAPPRARAAAWPGSYGGSGSRLL